MKKQYYLKMLLRSTKIKKATIILIYYTLIFILLYTINLNINNFLYMFTADTIIILITEFLKKIFFHHLFSDQ